LEQKPLPDVILLQEVIPQTSSSYWGRLISSGYERFPDSDPSAPYFTQAFVRVHSNQAERQLTVVRSTRAAFRNSSMGRDLVTVDASLRIVEGTTEAILPLKLMTSHLEVGNECRNKAAKLCRNKLSKT
jgi:hypothetical protein